MLRLDMNLVWTIINILIIFAIVKKFLFQPVNKILDARKEEIDRQYADAQKEKEDAGMLSQQVREALEGIEEKKAAAVREAREKAGTEYDRIVAEAQKEAGKILVNAREEADREQEKRMQEAQGKIAGLVLAAASKIVASKTGEEEDLEIYNQFIAKQGGLK